MPEMGTESIARLARQFFISYFKGPMYHVSNTQSHGPPSCLGENEAQSAQEERQNETKYLSSMKIQHIHRCYELDEMPYTRTLSDLTRQGELRNGKPVLSIFRRIWQGTYLPDYIALIVCYIISVRFKYYLKPFQQVFRLDDQTLQYPLAEEVRVTEFWLVIYSIVVPLVLLAGWAVLLRPGIHQLHITIFGLFASIVITRLFIQVTKNVIGCPRPDLIERCMPALGTPEHEFVTVDVCTQPNKRFLRDGWRSFPSGHSSFAFSGLVYLSLFLAGQLRACHGNASMASYMMIIIPTMGALLIAISRLEDYRHSILDVVVGALTGSLVAYVVYRNYYPGLQSKNCDAPYPPKFEYAPGNGFVRIRADDEEQGLQDMETFGTAATAATAASAAATVDDNDYNNNDATTAFGTDRTRIRNTP